jgi:hypothetical protein
VIKNRAIEAKIMMTRLFTIFAAILLTACGQGEPTVETSAGEAAAAPAAPAPLTRKPSPEGARAYIISPADGDTVDSPVRVLFGLSGAGVAPAGVMREGAGHHHLLIDTDLPNLDLPVPSDENHRHFGGGQTEVEIELSPGTHTLQLLLGDELHLPHDPPIMSDVVTIEVR